MKKFILTMDESTAKKLIASGFICLYSERNQWIFINHEDSEKNIDVDKVTFTDTFML